jgi:pimeloyl-ACP methyl ester carboxylesterase
MATAAVLVACVVAAAGCGSAADVADGPRHATGTSTIHTPENDTVAPSPGPPTGALTGSPATLPKGFGVGPPGRGVGRFYRQNVDWVACGSGYTCADIWVPLDYADPAGQAITVRAKLRPAGDEAARLGTLFIDPGGPGASGITYLENATFDAPISDSYDIVGFDPRGVATSTPLDCVSDAELDSYLASDPDPDTHAEVADLQRSWASFTAGCVARSGALLRHVSTVEVARDLDIMRAVVGDDKLSYFGDSYGTFIGATYAALFPAKVGRMVLDGAIDPLADPRTSDLNGAVGFETALTAYLTYCVDQGDCPVGDDVATARQTVVNLLAGLDSNPMPTSTSRDLTEGLAVYGLIFPLYSRDYWTYLTQALRGAMNFDGSWLLALSDVYTGRQRDGSYASNELEAQAAVNCLDKPEHESVAAIEASEGRFERAAPVFGSTAAWIPYSCSNWPVKPTEPVPDYSAKGAAPIVVVGTTRDPATPYEQAVSLANELDSGVLLSRDGDGHTAYASGNSCIDDAIDSYLANGVVPPDGTQC